MLRALTVIALAAACYLPAAAAAESTRSPSRPLIVLRDGRHWASAHPGSGRPASRVAVNGRLPRTGGATGMLALAGSGLLLLGAGMRLTAPRRPRTA